MANAGPNTNGASRSLALDLLFGSLIENILVQVLNFLSHLKRKQIIHAVSCPVVNLFQLSNNCSTPHLNGKHVVFGEVISGYDVGTSYVC